MPQSPEVNKTHEHLKEWLGFAFLNFATPVAFFIVFRALGTKAAIALAIGVTLVQVIVHLIYERPFSPFFMVSSGFTLIFGMMDLLATSPRFFRLAPAVENFMIGAIFVGSAFTRRPIVAWFAESLPDFVRPNVSLTGRDYLKNLTFVWGLYFWVKGIIFLYVAFQVDLGKLIIFRAIFGNVTFLLLFGGEIAYRKLFRA